MDALLHGDHFLVTADFEDYRNTHAAAVSLYRDPAEWTARAVLNTAAMGWFSSDRTILDYAREIWNVAPVLPGGGEAD